ncbi:hypothetical protein [Streptomyces sp. JJ36]|uniref:hypothetical protein n=1 Tax=Streptomyces sp. JJ36 TaxID=2736645 RepID=UPI001F283A1C|nr:hypothetical protein [Streptomyces sp. JJ36]MCF6525228.1 hypothetical protein [Streptomyces sp. JJ36]
MLEEKLNLRTEELGLLDETTEGEIPQSASPVLATPAAAAAFVAGATVVTGAYALGHAIG